jgi:pyruvate-formate lyase-activating enzyme
MTIELPRPLVADNKGRIYDLPHLRAAGMKAGVPFLLKPSDLIELHPDSELFMLPSRSPVVYDPSQGSFVEVRDVPIPGQKGHCNAVAAFLAPGYTATFSASYLERGKPGVLPLFSYASAVFYKGRIFATGTRVDLEKRQELAGMDTSGVQKGVRELRKIFPDNRLVRHLERCALSYCCPAARNFFLKRYEAPLPTSPYCNADCIGCISYQPGRKCPVTQPRIIFTPTPREIAEVAVFHIKNVSDPVVSFGQGCEGEPLMVGGVIKDAVRIIRRTTRKGMININTNASMPGVIGSLFDEGLDSIRVSMNSAREKYYTRYYRPKGYRFKDVVSSIKAAVKRGGFVSLNYLVMPGFTDAVNEFSSLRRLLDSTGIGMIQWRNLNYDPASYFRQMGIEVKPKDMVSLPGVMSIIRKEYPDVMHGYFNPSRGRIRRFKKRGRKNA